MIVIGSQYFDATSHVLSKLVVINSRKPEMVSKKEIEIGAIDEVRDSRHSCPPKDKKDGRNAILLIKNLTSPQERQGLFLSHIIDFSAACQDLRYRNFLDCSTTRIKISI